MWTSNDSSRSRNFPESTLRVHSNQTSLTDKTDFPTKEWVERVVIFKPPPGVKGAKLTSKTLGSVDLETSYTSENKALVIRKPGVNIREPFSIKLY
ncbi:unnamed protein product [Callosobruchus maculatus]|uniref:Uncharacterized protein n=1 Tax=Callosobruchus maculatus TaxID=64391 RepID=A0A653C4J1_CALMS|nr:unnamed protein product [Callosobruchus maculatus]VEN42827.1 unnamed protein product [Callosobruchus maculatus]VEN42828.1 unnamed protein product [Callosobruchus maculatus]